MSLNAPLPSTNNNVILRCREVFSNNTDVNPDLEGYMDLDDRRYLKTTDGVELWKQRWENHCEFSNPFQ